MNYLSSACPNIELMFCASKKGRVGGGGRVSARGAVHMAAALAVVGGFLLGVPCTWRLPWLAVGLGLGLGQHWLDHFSPC